MKFFILKGKWMLFLMVVCAMLLTAIVGMAFSKSVFNVGSKNLPLYSVETSTNDIAITFNCAWGDEDIDSILKTLSDNKCRATFFIVGDWAEKYPEAVKKINDAHHEIGMHSYDHKDYTKLNEEQIIADLHKNSDSIERVTGITPKLMRASSGSYNNNVILAIEKDNRIPIQWSIDSLDYKCESAEAIFDRISGEDKVVAGDIILFHTGTKYTKVALSRILNSLSGRYNFVTVSELIPQDEFYVDNTGKAFLK